MYGDAIRESLEALEGLRVAPGTSAGQQEIAGGDGLTVSGRPGALQALGQVERKGLVIHRQIGPGLAPLAHERCQQTGSAPIAQLLLAVQDLLELQVRLIEARADHASAWARLEHIVGRPVQRRSEGGDHE